MRTCTRAQEPTYEFFSLALCLPIWQRGYNAATRMRRATVARFTTGRSET
jgi:hypothetical protein